jgi:hypothetical protein
MASSTAPVAATYPSEFDSTGEFEYEVEGAATGVP